MARTTVRFVGGQVQAETPEDNPPVTVEHGDDEYLLWLSTSHFGLKSYAEPGAVYWRAALARRVEGE